MSKASDSRWEQAEGLRRLRGMIREEGVIPFHHISFLTSKRRLQRTQFLKTPAIQPQKTECTHVRIKQNPFPDFILENK